MLSPVSPRLIKLLANWMLQEVVPACEREGLLVTASKVSPEQLATLLEFLDNGVLSNAEAKAVFGRIWKAGTPEDTDLVVQLVLELVRSRLPYKDLQLMLLDAIGDNKKAADEYFLQGKDKAVNALVGTVMKASGGRADPAEVRQMLADVREANRSTK